MEKRPFSFPLLPYPIQLKFMNELYSTIEKSNHGIFESPTGTGKSLSICCAALKWLQDWNFKYKELLKEEMQQLKFEREKCKNSNSDGWIEEEYNLIKNSEAIHMIESKLNLINERLEYYKSVKEKLRKNALKFNKSLKHKEANSLIEDNVSKPQSELDDDRDLVLTETCSDEDSDDVETEEKENKSDIMKVYFSSRTHSQLSQFVGEIKKTEFRDSIRLVVLASRQQYCINDVVKRLKNINLINERCLDMQKSKAKKTLKDSDGNIIKKNKTGECYGRCPYFNMHAVKVLKDVILSDVMDVEDLVKTAKEVKACPYYASKMAYDDAEVVLVTHAGIIGHETRKGVQLDLNNKVVIFDEAHGITNALENAHSAPVTEKQLDVLAMYLQFYINQYLARFSSQNLLMLRQLAFVLKKLLAVLKNAKTNCQTSQDETTIMTQEEFVISSEIDNINISPLIEFCTASRLAAKLHGFYLKYDQKTLEEQKSVDNKKINSSETDKKKALELFLKDISKRKSNCKNDENASIQKEQTKINQNNTTPGISAGNCLYSLLEFLDRLRDPSDNGRILINKDNNSNRQLKYLLLNPAEPFTRIVMASRSIVLAGGTMEPITEFKTLLTSNKLNADLEGKINIVKCEHVVPPENVLAICLSKGPSNVHLDFTYTKRMSEQMLTEVCRILRNVCNVVPGGVVCFLPSYSYEQSVFSHMETHKVLECIQKKKKIFREPINSSEVDNVLNNFSTAVYNKEKGQNGALLLSVVGGKLSEGLNFSDDLGRCIIVVGMPYPNIKSPELKLKMEYLNANVGPNAGAEHYESLCMKAVNQCIGRAVRHARDYACVILADGRYSRATTRTSLPTFLQKSLVTDCSFGPAIGNIAKFFAKHK